MTRDSGKRYITISQAQTVPVTPASAPTATIRISVLSM